MTKNPNAPQPLTNLTQDSQFDRGQKDSAVTADVGTGLGTGCHLSGLRGLTRSDEKAGLHGIMPT